MTDLRALAAGKPCQIRLPWVCLDDRESTVLCHVRMVGISGMGLKADDLLASWGCARCHAYVDTHHDDATRLVFLEGVMRTLAYLIKLGVIRWT